MNSVKILHAVRSAITAIAELLVALSHRTTKGSMLSYNIAGLISEVSEEVTIQIAKNCRR